MDTLTLDPYEQQLLSVFDSYDHDNLGSLDKTGLTLLCKTLQLEEQSADLIRRLLKDPNHARATFPEFKEALLTLLGNMQKNDSNKSPEREVSPKYYGSKKYGRRTRPKIDDEISPVIEEQTEGVAVQRSNSQSEVFYSKKRKTNYKVKRCTSYPGTHNVLSPEIEFVCSEDMLREAWKKLGVGKDGYLNQNELIDVCDAIGLHKLADSVIRQLSNKFNRDHKVSFQELLEALQQDETWSDVLDTNLNINNDLFPDSKTFQFVTLGPDGNGFITADALIEMWEIVGITSPKELLHELGFNNRKINIVELAAVIDKEVKGMHDTAGSDPNVILLRANLTLYQSEIKCLKNLFEQLHAEREKLRNDVTEANNRAKLLAQEVDDNHAKMERNTQKQVKLLEHRHSDILKNITEQYTGEKEHLSLLNQNLESKIASLENEIAKLKNDLEVAQQYSSTLEKENHNLSGEIKELLHVKDTLHGQIEQLENDKQKCVETEQEQLEPLLAKLSLIQVENAELRDKNDEMLAQIETLGREMSAMKSQKTAPNACFSTLDRSMDENIAIVCDGVGLGAKRRSDSSPSKDAGLFDLVGGSPRLGKVRKFYKDQLDSGPFVSHESGFDTEIDISDTSSQESEEITRLQAKIRFLEKILQQHSIPIPDELVDDELDLRSREHLLEKIFTDLHKVRQMFDKNGVSCTGLAQIGDKLEKLMKNEPICADAATETDPDEKLQKFTEENAALKEKCQELESCIELLRGEYEKCEDYWQGKLDEERQIYEQEQQQNSEKLADLINKMAEYEEQFVNQESRLPPIEETENLEQQFNDLEQEFQCYRHKTQEEMFRKEEEIDSLKLQIDSQMHDFKDASIQANALKATNLTACIVETTNLLSSEALPPQKETLSWSRESNKSEDSWPASTSNSNVSTLEKNTTPCRPKRTRKHDKTNLYKRMSEEKKTGDFVQKDNAIITLPVRTIQGLNGRLYHLEQRCRQLQMALKQQHFFAEQAISQHAQNHRMEKSELQCLMRNLQEKLEHQCRSTNEQLEKLTRSDMLIKELYVENSYLIAKVQRLEEQCDFLARRSSNNSL